MKPLKVKRTPYTKVSQDGLLIYAQQVVANTLGKDAYADIAEPVNILNDRTIDYDKKLVAAADRSKKAVFAKNQSKQDVINALNDVAKWLELTADGRKSYIVDAGMEVLEYHRKTKVMTKPLIPVQVDIHSEGVVGELKVNFKLLDSNIVKLVGGEWSIDGNSWTNGSYFKDGGGTMTNLPSLQEILVRLRAISEDGTTGDWTIPVKVPVL